jgi:phosphate acetyltransferase
MGAIWFAPDFQKRRSIREGIPKMDFIEQLSKKIKDRTLRIVFPEGEEAKILLAASMIFEKGIALPVILGSAAAIKQLAAQENIDLTGLEIIDPSKSELLDSYIKIYSEKRNFPENASRRIVQPNLGFGAMMVKEADAYGMIAGISHPTDQVIMVSQLIIGMQEGITTPSSFMVLDIPAYQGREGSLLVIADPAINPDPDPEQLADIAIATAQSVRDILEWEPRVAMLSFSTHGSASHPLVDKVARSVAIIRERLPSLKVDGEIQLDAAIDPEVAKRKVKCESQVAGSANILIFPDLNSGNIGCKLVQRLGGARAYGAVLQGFALPVSDLSRGATVEDVIGVATMLVVRGQKK